MTLDNDGFNWFKTLMDQLLLVATLMYLICKSIYTNYMFTVKMYCII